jgi:hypothetical protein
VCFPDVLTVYWTWETPNLDLLASDMSVSVPPLLSPLPTIQHILGAAVADRSVLGDAEAFAARVWEGRSPMTVTSVAAECGILFLGDELQTVYDTPSVHLGNAVALIEQLREIGKINEVVACLAGSSTRMYKYTLAPDKSLLDKGFIDLNHGTYEVVSVHPPRTIEELSMYIKHRFTSYAVVADVASVLYETGGNGKEVGRVVIDGETMSSPAALLSAVNDEPALRALFVRFASIVPSVERNAALVDPERHGAFDCCSISVSEALGIIVGTGQPDSAAFLRSMESKGFLYLTRDYGSVQPMRPMDVTTVMRSLNPLAP